MGCLDRCRTRKLYEENFDFVFFQGRLNRAIVVKGLKHDLLAAAEASVSERNVAVCSIADNGDPWEAALILHPDFDVECVANGVS